jgi:3',5'-nucleoside bisphosphate phosphatase
MSITIKNDSHSSEGWADLHVHTTISDGLFTPEHVVKVAIEKDLRAISITDHDAIRGIKPATEEALKYDLEIIPGIELSTIDNHLDVHILGYFFDLKNEKILHYIHLFQEERIRRAEKIVKKLFGLGMKLNFDLIIKKAGIGSVGRPHIADALMEEGYVLSYDEAFYKYLGNEKPAYVPKYKISPGEGIELIHQAKGLSFVAHPGMDIDTEYLTKYIKQGLDGIEILHPKHNQDKVNELYQLAVQHQLLVSGGSDCHGNRKGNEMMGLFNVPYQFVEDIKHRLEIMKGLPTV